MKTSTTANALLRQTPHSTVGLQLLEELFDHAPDVTFFVKDREGRYLVVNASLVERCGARTKAELIGKLAREVFPGDLGNRPANQDAAVLRTGRPIHDHLELHWHAPQRQGWCLTTKLPWRDADGNIIGLVGISRDVRAPENKDDIPAGLATALEHFENNLSEPILPSELAKLAGLSPVRFARLIKRIFRISPSQLITKTRLSAASRLLRETDQSIADIALACGFYDHSAFTRAFRAATGNTPSEFRSRR